MSVVPAQVGVILCQDMDGRHYPMSQYEVGVTAPPFHPWCRSTTVPYFNDEWGRSGERVARAEDGKRHYIPNDMNYGEWKQTFVDDSKQPNLTVNPTDDIMNSGALSGALNPNSKEAYKHAAKYYESVRKITTDCEAISKKTGYDVSFVKDVKEHLFMTKHDLGNGVDEYFFPDYEIAQSWQRLMDSNMKLQSHDLILLEHEHEEFIYMQQGMTQAQAHAKAEEKYNYAKALRERK